MFNLVKNKMNLNALSFILILAIILSMLPFNGINDYISEASTQPLGLEDLAQKAIQNQKVEYEEGSEIGLNDIYILEHEGVDTAAWMYDGTSLKDKAISRIEEILVEPNKNSGKDAYVYSAKELAQGYLAMKELGDTAKADDLLEALKGRQNISVDGSFDSNGYSDLPALDILGRENLLDEIRTESAIEYVLNTQIDDPSDSNFGSWPSSYPDFISTAQTVRTLTYLRGHANAEDKLAIQQAIENGITWMKSKQQNDGSFLGESWEDPVVNTAEVILTLNILGEDLNSWQKGEMGPVDYLLKNALNKDGTFGSNKNNLDNTSMLNVCKVLPKYYESKLAEKAVKNQKSEFEEGNVIGLYDTYILEQVEVYTAAWMYDGTSLKDKAISRIEEILVEPNKNSGKDAYVYSAKELAQGYLAMKELGDTAKADDLLEALKGRQNISVDGSFDSNGYSDLPALDILGRENLLDEIRTESAIEYILNTQIDDPSDSNFGSWPSSYPDFISTAQTVRALTYLRGHANAEDKLAIQQAIENGITWMKSKQQNDGSFLGESWEDPVVNTAEVILTLNILGEDINSWQKGEVGPVDYLLKNALNADGTFGSNKNNLDNTSILEVFLIMGTDLTPISEDSDDDEEVTPPNEETIQVNIKIIGKDRETIFEPNNVTLSEDDKWGQTAMGALHKTNVSYKIDSSNYVESIAGQKYHGMDGWMYKVENKIKGIPAPDCDVDDGDYILWFYSTDPDNITELGELKEEDIDINKAKENAEKKISDALKKGEKPVLEIREDDNGKVYLLPKTLAELAEKNMPLLLENGDMKIEISPNALKNDAVNQGMKNQRASVEIKADELDKEEKEKFLKKIESETLKKFIEAGDGIIDVTARVVYSDSDGDVEKTEKINQFFEPVKITMKVSKDLREEELIKLTGVRYETGEDGKVVPVKVGGVYDAESKTMTFYADRFAPYGIAQVDELRKINLQIEQPSTSVNEEEKAMDVSPTIINDRTMVPIRFISETFGAEVEWNGETKTVTINYEGQVLELVVGETSEIMDTPPTIVNDRTLVPLRYISETFDANVLWIPSSRSVEIVK